MGRLLNVSRLWGPLSTVVFTVAYHFGSITFGYPVNVVWIVTFVILGTFSSGLCGGVLAALWSSAYVIYAIDDFGRLVQIIPFLFLYAGLVGWQTRKLRQYYHSIDVLYNGSRIKLEQALAYIRHAKACIQSNNLDAAKKSVFLAEDKLGNTLAGVVGYKALYDVMTQVEEWHTHPENIKKLQQMDTENPKEV